LKVKYSFECICGLKHEKEEIDNFITVKTNKTSEDFRNLINNLTMSEEVLLECSCSKNKDHTQKKRSSYNFKDCSFLIIRINNYQAEFANEIVHKNNFLSIYGSITRLLNFKSDITNILGTNFTLKAAVTHHGNLNAGHYNCLIRTNYEKNEWIDISDNKCEKCEDPAATNLVGVFFLILEKIK